MDEPELGHSDIFYLKAFYDLSTCRESGMGVGSIPWTSILEYAKWYRLERDVAEAFVDIIRSLDQSYISYMDDERERKKNQSKQP